MGFLLNGFLLGLGGSLHCIGMCGPIAVALPTNKDASRSRMIAGRLLYNVGRTITYALVGAVMGLVGEFILMAGWQQGLSIGAGVFILAWVVVPKKYLAKLGGMPGLNYIYIRFKRLWSSYFQRSTPASMLVFGLLNGMLPCGLVYLGLAVAAASGSAVQGALVMASFGLGTMATMLPASIAGSMLNLGARQWFRRLVPTAAAILAILFIARGVLPSLMATPESADGSAPPPCPMCVK